MARGLMPRLEMGEDCETAPCRVTNGEVRHATERLTYAPERHDHGLTRAPGVVWVHEHDRHTGAATLVGGTLSTAMVAGLMFCFARSVMPGFGTLDDRGFLTAFQRIDAPISNPWMMLTFLASPGLTLAALLVHLPSRSPAVPWILVALVLVMATVLITGAINLPSNAAMQHAAPELPDAATLRSRFEERWVRCNRVRAVTSTGALGALCCALSVADRAAG